MVRIKLDELKAEIYKYIGIPYFSNNPPIKLPEKPDNVFLGKGSAKDIALQTIEFANREKIKILDLSSKEIYNFQKKHHLGIDCSGLVYQLLLFINPKAEGKIVGDGGIPQGITKVSANHLTSPANSKPITGYDKIKTGDLIRMDNGKHVIFIIEKIKDLIIYVHSSHKTKTRGVHYGTITINDPGKTLDHQEWSDQTLTGTPYSKLFHPENGDGIFRPHFLK